MSEPNLFTWRGQLDARLDNMTRAELDALALRKFSYAGSYERWVRMGRPTVGYHRTRLLAQLHADVDAAKADLGLFAGVR